MNSLDVSVFGDMTLTNVEQRWADLVASSSSLTIQPLDDTSQYHYQCDLGYVYYETVPRSFRSWTFI
jgi:hypothetical protein